MCGSATSGSLGSEDCRVTVPRDCWFSEITQNAKPEKPGRGCMSIAEGPFWSHELSTLPVCEVGEHLTHGNELVVWDSRPLEEFSRLLGKRLELLTGMDGIILDKRHTKHTRVLRKIACAILEPLLTSSFDPLWIAVVSATIIVSVVHEEVHRGTIMILQTFSYSRRLMNDWNLMFLESFSRADPQ